MLDFIQINLNKINLNKISWRRIYLRGYQYV